MKNGDRFLCKWPTDIFVTPDFLGHVDNLEKKISSDFKMRGLENVEHVRIYPDDVNASGCAGIAWIVPVVWLYPVPYKNSFLDQWNRND